MNRNTADAVIITVGTTEQKKLCEKLISDMKLADIIVVCDEDFGGRIGSGGALLGVMEKFYETGKKLLVINSGGMSKRSFCYAVRGKLFANLSVNGKTVSLLEMLVKEGKKLFSLFDSGVVVCCSDIPVNTENIKNKFFDNAGVAIRTDFVTGSRHGVMYRDKNNFLDIYPHKISSEKLRSLSEKYGEKNVLADTGLIYFKDELCMTLKKFAEEEKVTEALSENKVDLNLYPDIVALLANKIDEEYFVSSNKTHEEVRKKLNDKLSLFSLEVLPLEDKFVHMGSMKEALENIFFFADENEKSLSLNSFVDEKSVIGKGSALDNCLFKNCVVGENSIVCDVTLENCNIGNGKAVCGVKLTDGSFITIVCDIEESPKDINNGIELWNTPRFYKGKSYTDSYNKFISQSCEEKLSMSECMENADVQYYFTRCRYLKDMSSCKVNENYLKLRKEILNNFFSEKDTTKSIKCKKEKAEVSLPVRVNFSGTWTDAMPYCIYNGGEVVNMAVTVDGENPIKVTAEKIKEKQIVFSSDGMSEVFTFDKLQAGEEISDFNLHRAVLEVVGINKDTVIEDGFRLSAEVFLIDKGSGLGVSSILLGGCFSVLGELLGKEYTDEEIFRMVFVAEQIMKTGGGWQDQTGGLTKGLKIISTNAGYEQIPEIERINLSSEFKNFISEKFILVPTGQRHFGRFIVNDVAGRYLDKKEESLSAHAEIKELNKKITDCIEKNNFKGFSEGLNRHFELLKKISPAVSDKKIDALTSSLLETKADAVSICGAGGGGYLLVIMKDGETVESVSSFIKNKFSYITGKVRKIDIAY